MTNTTFVGNNASVRFPSQITIDGRTNLSVLQFNITQNSVFFNSTEEDHFNVTFLNTSAEIILYGLSLTTLQILVDAEDDGSFVECNSSTTPACNNLSYDGSTLVFNVTSFTTYSTQEAPNAVPTHDSPIINSTLGTNQSSENLTCYPQNLADADGDAVYPIFNWLNNGVSTTVLNMPFETNNSENVTDYSGYGNNGTINGNPIWDSIGKIGGAYVFDGSGDYISIPDDDSLDVNSGESYAVEFWMKTSTSSNRVIMEKGSNDVYAVQTTAGGSVSLAGSLGVSAATLINNNDWYHIVFTYNGFNVTVYINGVLDKVGGNASRTPNSDQLVIGARSGGSVGFPGTLDGVKIYNSSLSNESIYQHYIEGLNALNTSTIVSQETATGENWTCEVTPNDLIEDGALKNVSLTVLADPDTTPPNLTIISPLNQTYNIAAVLVNLTASSDATSIFFFNGTENVTTTNGGDGLFVTFNEGSNTLIAYANDSAGNLNTSSVVFSVDTIEPVINIVYPQNITYNINVSELNYTVSETGLCWYSIDDGGTNSSTVVSGVNFTDVTSVEQNNTWTIYCNDSVGNKDHDEILFTKDTADPTVTINSPLNNSYRNRTVNVDIQAINVAETSIDSIFFFNGTENVTWTTPVLVNFSEGSNTLIAYANDTAGNEGNKTVIFNVDTTVPNVTIINPANITYNNANVLVNLSNSSDAATTFFFNGTENVTYTAGSAGVNVVFNEGPNTLIAYANDSLGNLNTTNVNFAIDTVAPNLTINEPLNITYDNKTISVDLTNSSDAANTWFFNGTENVTWTAPVLVNFSEGSNTLIAYANDSVGNLNTSIRIFFVDTGAPVITIESPANITYDDEIILVNLTAIDATLDAIWFFNGTENVTTTNGGDGVFVTFNEGSNTLIAYANDSANNLGTETVLFNVDLTPPNVSIISPANITYNIATILVNLTNSSDAANTLFFNGTENVTYTTPVNVVFNEGSNTLIAYVNDSVGNENSTSVIFNVDSGPPEISIISPLNITYNDETILVNITANGSSIDTVFFFNGTENVTTTNGGDGVFVDFNEGSNTLIAYVNDSVGNENSTTVIFSVDTVAPNLTIVSPANITYNSAAVLVNLSNSCDAVTTFFFNGTENVTYTAGSAGVTVTFNEGSNTLIAYANDSVGNENSTTVIFSVDTVAPNLTIISPVNQSYNSPNILINLSNSSDAATTFFFNGTENVTYTSETYVNYSNGGHTLIAYANDSVGNLNVTSVTFSVFNTKISSGPATLNVENAIYTLTSNINCSGACVTIAANNITLDCQGNLINYSNSNTGYGVRNIGYNDSTIKNCGILQEDPNINLSHGVYLSGAAGLNLTGNSIITYGNDSAGVRLDGASSGNNISRNSITVDLASGVEIFSNSSFFNVIYNNTINSSEEGISITYSIIDLIIGNLIITSKSDSSGVFIENASITFLANNTFDSSNFDLSLFGSDFIILQDQYIEDYTVNDTLLILEDTSYGALSFIYRRINQSGTNLSGDIQISDNKVFVNSTSKSGLNLSAGIDLYGLSFSNPRAIVDYNDNDSYETCSEPQCIELAYSGGIFTFNVSSFTSYSSEETPTISVGGGGGGGGGGGRALAPTPTLPVVCVESWSCTEWNKCIDGKQVRTCTDSNACGTKGDKPTESQDCEVKPRPLPIPDVDFKLVIWAVSSILALVLIIEAIVLRKKFKGKGLKMRSKKLSFWESEIVKAEKALLGE